MSKTRKKKLLIVFKSEGINNWFLHVIVQKLKIVFK